jgi:hypothetical protein
MVSIKVLGKHVVEPKTLGWENSQKSFENVFRKPWSSIYSTEMFLGKYVLEKWSWTWELKELVIYKSGIVYKCSPNQLTHATTLPWYGMGLSLKFICCSAGSLILYKGL